MSAAPSTLMPSDAQPSIATAASHAGPQKSPFLMASSSWRGRQSPHLAHLPERFDVGIAAIDDPLATSVCAVASGFFFSLAFSAQRALERGGRAWLWPWPWRCRFAESSFPAI